MSASATQKGDTQSVTDMLKELSKEHIGKWDIEIQRFYYKGTPRYVELLPKGRRPFQQGKQENRLQQVARLIKNMGDDPSLAALKATIQNWYANADAKQGTKEGKKGVTKTNSDAVEIERVEGCHAMWKNLMTLGDHFYKTPESAAPFFNWEVLRSGDQSSFSITIQPGKSKLLAKRTLAASARLSVINDSDVPAEIGCTDKSGAIVEKVTVPPHSQKLYNAADIGNSKATPYIMITNATGIASAHLMIEIVKE